MLKTKIAPFKKLQKDTDLETIVYQVSSEIRDTISRNEFNKRQKPKCNENQVRKKVNITAAATATTMSFSSATTQSSFHHPPSVTTTNAANSMIIDTNSSSSRPSTTSARAIPFNPISGKTATNISSTSTSSGRQGDQEEATGEEQNDHYETDSDFEVVDDDAII